MANTLPMGINGPAGMPSMFPSNFPGAQQVVIPQITIPQPPVMQQIQQPPAQVRPGVDIHCVHGLDGAKQFPTQPNSRYALFDDSEDIFYIKVTDQNNYPVELKRYCFIEEDEPVQATPQYVTVEEFNKFKEEMLNGKQPVRAESAPATNDAAKSASK